MGLATANQSALFHHSYVALKFVNDIGFQSYFYFKNSLVSTQFSSQGTFRNNVSIVSRYDEAFKADYLGVITIHQFTYLISVSLLLRSI